MEKIVIRGEYALLGKSGTLVTPVKNDAAVTRDVAPKDTGSTAYSPWGDNNLFPQEVLTDLEKNTVAWRALDKRKRVHYGRGIVAYREDANGVRTVASDPAIVEFFRVNKINKSWIDHIGSLEIFANSWLEMITNKGRDQINRVYPKDPAYCRLAKMNEKTRIPSLFYSAQWDNNPSVDDTEKVITIPMYDPDRYNIETGVYGDGKFIYPTFYRSFNRSYYHTAIWNSIRVNKWMDIANWVPELKAAIMKNQMTIKYHITVPDDYFTNRYPMPTFTKEEQEAKRKEVLDDMDDFLAGHKNAGKTFVTFAFYDKVKQDYKNGWKIEVLEDKIQDARYLPDSQAANSEILFAIGVDPCLIGAGLPGGKLGAGSGSDKREAFWMLNADMGPDRQVSLEPLYFIRDFNGWDPQIQFDYVVVDTSQTQDQHPTKTEKRIDQTQP